MQEHDRNEGHSRCRRSVGLVVGLVVAFGAVRTASSAPAPAATVTVPPCPFDGRRAYGYLEQLCALGPRMSGSEGMRKQQELLAAHFRAGGATVQWQRFRARQPLGGGHVRMANLVCSWHPDRAQRILLCAHYDTRPLPDRDRDPRRRRDGTFVGANDGASGVAVLMELAAPIATLSSPYGVDIVLFDGEEFVYDERRDPYFLGSTWFARKYVSDPPAHPYRWGILLDMVGDADLQIYQERHSMTWPDTRPLVLQLWAVAERLGRDEFISRKKHTVRDDHLKLRNIARIPTCDIIDFDYPFWHTEADTPSKCSAHSLAAVGCVLFEWLRTVE